MIVGPLRPELIGALATVFVHDLLPRRQFGSLVPFGTNFAPSVREISHELEQIESAKIRARFGQGPRKQRMPRRFGFVGLG